MISILTTKPSILSQETLFNYNTTVKTSSFKYNFQVYNKTYTTKLYRTYMCLNITMVLSALM